MNILWFSWKDTGHPQSGGAETISHEIMSRLVRDGHSVKLITSGYASSGQVTLNNGIETHYVGSRFTVYLKARDYYRKNLKGWDDITVDEMNTLPFLAGSYTTARKRILVAYQLAREVWFYQMIFPFSALGYFVVEPILLRIAAQLYQRSLTESKSSKLDMERYGFKNVRLFSVGIEMKPQRTLRRNNKNLILSLGSVRPMKRTLHAVKAFEHARDTNIDLHMVIAGDISSAYGARLKKYVERSRHCGAIDILGKVSNKERLDLMREAGLILVTSIKEGWGLIVTESNSQGLPAIVYDVDGLRDSVQNGLTGIVTRDGNPEEMGEAILSLLDNSEKYKLIRDQAWESSKLYTFDNSYKTFLEATGINGS